MHRVQPYREENLVVRRTMQRGRGSHPMAKSDIEKDAPKSGAGGSSVPRSKWSERASSARTFAALCNATPTIIKQSAKERTAKKDVAEKRSRRFSDCMNAESDPATTNRAMI
jgi:hypothetical protein